MSHTIPEQRRFCAHSARWVRHLRQEFRSLSYRELCAAADVLVSCGYILEPYDTLPRRVFAGRDIQDVVAKLSASENVSTITIAIVRDWARPLPPPPPPPESVPMVDIQIALPSETTECQSTTF